MVRKKTNKKPGKDNFVSIKGELLYNRGLGPVRVGRLRVSGINVISMDGNFGQKL